jgi:hypothetical protein
LVTGTHPPLNLISCTMPSCIAGFGFDDPPGPPSVELDTYSKTRKQPAKVAEDQLPSDHPIFFPFASMMSPSVSSAMSKLCFISANPLTVADSDAHVPLDFFEQGFAARFQCHDAKPADPVAQFIEQLHVF